MINQFTDIFETKSKLFLANTNPAVDNMRRRVTSHSDDMDFMTATKFLMRRDSRIEYDILIIDECSTLSNQDMNSILEKVKLKLLVLVGDLYQIEAIKFGNWFISLRSFIPKTSVFELTYPHRSNNIELKQLWDKVRNNDDRIIEYLARNNYSTTLDSSLFDTADPDEIILCLNYDGLYGINNVNRFLQQANSEVAIKWGLNTYKVGDPVLFYESERFAPIIYNNVKGWIRRIEIINSKIQFDIEVQKPINGLDANVCGFDLLDCSVVGHSIIRFLVDDYRTVDENEEISSTAVVPFQIAYAVSIHKAQGLEYSSVKIVITDDAEDRISHSIFYTAITRAWDRLKIYWTPEVGNRVISSLKPLNNSKDVAFLKQII